jgi:MFS family permease
MGGLLRETQGSGGERGPGAPLAGRALKQAVTGIYGTAFFSLSMHHMASILVPLWMVKLGASPLWIGIAIGARSFLPLLFSIHGGVLMDRLGTRRVTLAVALMAMALFPIYPFMPWMAAIIVLQLLFGLAQGLCWIGAQTFYGNLMRGHAGHAGRLVFFSSAGSFAGPMLIGAVVEFGGNSMGFAFLCLWALMMVLFTLLAPGDKALGLEASKPVWRDIVPRAADYKSALALCLLPVVAMVMSFTFIRIGVASIQTSFYVVYLGQIEMGETLIGILLGTGNLVATLTPPLIQLFARRVSTMSILVGATLSTTIFMAITPLLHSFVPLLIAAALYGAGVGLGFPTLLTMLSGTVAREDQGKSVGLRTSVNRLGSLIVPVAMGAVAEVFSIAMSFAVVAVMALAGTFVTTLWVWRQPGLWR